MKKMLSIVVLCILCSCNALSQFVEIPNKEFEKNKIGDLFMRKGDTLYVGTNDGDLLMNVDFVQVSYNRKANELSLKGTVKDRRSKEAAYFVCIYLGVKDKGCILFKEKIVCADVSGEFDLTVVCKSEDVLIFDCIAFVPVVYDVGSISISQVLQE